MPRRRLILISLPALRTRDLDHMPRLRAVAEAGACREFVPSFPCVTSPVQMNMLTGRPPNEHGIIGNGFYHRDRGVVELWVGRNGLAECDQLWDSLAKRGIFQAAWFPQNVKDAAADFIITPEPIHHTDGRTESWCYSKPEGLYRDLQDELGPFPLMSFWGPMAGIKSTEWIVSAALWLLVRERPRFNFIYIPHLDYAAQRFGPDSPQQEQACREADEELGRLFDGIAGFGPPEVSCLIVGEYAMTEVSRVVYPNRLLREAGLLAIEEKDNVEYLRPAAARAFAVVDHQFAHVYVKSPADVDAVAAVFAGADGISRVLTGRDRAALHVDHPRSGEVILVCRPDTWLAYYWWKDDAAAPPFARTVDIHNKPGYDPVELFFDRQKRQIPLDPTLVRGSHGAPAASPAQQAACIATSRDLLPPRPVLKDTDIRPIIEQALRD